MNNVRFTFTLLGFLSACGPDHTGFERQDDVNASAKSTRDIDGDGYSEATGDCDESDAYVNPGAIELCDGLDNDCDDAIDDEDSYHVDNIWAPDVDGDGFNDNAGMVMACEITSLEDFADYIGGDFNTDDWSQLGEDDYIDADGDGDVDDIDWDCDDADDTVYPGAPELCDGMANDCDTADTWTEADEASMTSTFYADVDGDSYGDASSSTSACEASEGWVEDDTDCDDGDGSVYPGADETCDELDNDCDGDVDEGVTAFFYADLDEDGHGDMSTSVESCEAPAGYVASDDDCDDGNGSVYPGADETCDDDGLDNDCDDDSGDTPVDEVTRYEDVDGDGYGDASSSFTSCTAPGGYVEDNTDCDDTDASIHPGAGDDGSDGIDNDCDGLIDEDPCDFVIRTLGSNGDATAITGISSADSSLDGEWYSGSVSGVTVIATHLGGAAWSFYSYMNLCTGTLIYDVDFADGSSLGDGASQNTKAWKDGVSVSAALYDNGDGTFAYEFSL